MVSLREASLLGALRFHGADGGGAGSTGSLTLIQTEFASPLDGNVVMVIFDETSSRGVTVLVDGTSVGDFLGEGAVFVSFLDAGEHTFRVESQSPEGPMFSEETLVVLDAQPFGDPTDLTCEGDGPGEEGTCWASLRWSAPAIAPDFFWVLQDTQIAERNLSGAETRVRLPRVPAGQHAFALRGFQQARPESPRVLYAGQTIETICTISCDGAACRPPVVISLCQSAYGADRSAIRAEVLPGGDYPGGIDILAGGSLVKNVPVAPGGRTVAFLPALQPGPLTLSFRGECEEGRVTAATDAAITLLEQSPLPDPVEGVLSCELQPGQGMTATWRNGFPADFIDVYLVSAQRTLHVATVPGGTESISIPEAVPGDAVAIQAFKDVGGLCSGSRLASCSQGERRFLRGLCDDSGGFPSLSSGVFTLNYLFLGGTEPPCLEACDTDGDSRLDLSDAVFIFNFLFLGGPAPPGWDSSGGTPVPTCETGSEAGCAAAHSACS